MDEKELNELRELVEFLKTNGIAEFDMEREGQKIRLKFQGEAPTAGFDPGMLAKLMAAPAPAPVSIAAQAAPAAAAAPPAAAPAAEADPHAGMHMVTSPIVGTFYDAPSPDAPVFVKVGDHVEVGTVLCIVEAMKLMNEIESDFAGEVVKVLPSAGQPVEYGQPLFVIK
jgi:acetyl-CoA carboxylase biotin carboxyl carrier protein